MINVKINKPKRLVLFSFYDDQGIVDDYVLYLLKELSKESSRIILVVNGIITDGLEKVKLITSEVVIRENIGYDAGAYKYLICEYLKEDELKNYDELVLCNDTFFGPFVSLRDILDKMDGRRCDYWGFNLIKQEFFSYLQSFFLVFKSNTFTDLTDYFYNRILLRTNDISQVYDRFEVGLHEYMKYQGYKYGAYCESNIHPVICGNRLLRAGLPLIKRRFFKECDNKYNIGDALEYIKSRYKYDVGLIISSNRRRGLPDVTHADLMMDEGIITLISYNDGKEEEIFRYLNENKDIYIYGAGKISEQFYNKYMAYRKNTIRAYIVSSLEGKQSFLGQKVIEYSNVLEKEHVVVAMGKNNTKEITERLGINDNWLYLYWD